MRSPLIAALFTLLSLGFVAAVVVGAVYGAGLFFATAFRVLLEVCRVF